MNKKVATSKIIKKGEYDLEVVRITFRIPKYLETKVKLLAEENDISMNKQLIELIEFGIQYFLEKTNLLDENNIAGFMKNGK